MEDNPFTIHTSKWLKEVCAKLLVIADSYWASTSET